MVLSEFMLLIKSKALLLHTLYTILQLKTKNYHVIDYKSDLYINVARQCYKNLDDEGYSKEVIRSQHYTIIKALITCAVH